MARNIDQRLKSLDSRRRGTDRIAILNRSEAEQVLAKSLLQEAYAKRSTGLRYTKYALGAMQAVDTEYTRISREEADRVGKQIVEGLEKQGRGAELRLQGSVPADVHIRGVSDVDLLVIEKRYYRYDPNGARALRGEYQNPVTYDTLTALGEFRKSCEVILDGAYPVAKVDKSGAKAVKISGGSLRRPVDVVPANWIDNKLYQLSSRESDRGVEILDTSVPTRIENLPFLHIEKLYLRDVLSGGGLKKAIRLCKSVKADAQEEGTNIKLSSFDIASTMWHADLVAMMVGTAYELAILEETRRHLNWLSANRPLAIALDVPDGSRKVFDTNERFEALVQLASEVTDLAENVAREQARLTSYVSLNSETVKDVLRKAYIAE